MKYSIHIPEKQGQWVPRVELVGSRWGRVIRALLLLFFGILFAPFGLVAMFPNPHGTSAGIAGAAGLLMLGGALHMLFATRSPRRLIFDNERCMLLVQQSFLAKECVLLPYAEIRCFRVMGSDGAGMELEDGSVWSILSCSSRKEADESVTLLQESVQLRDGGTRAEQPAFSSRVTMTQEGDAVKVSWRNGRGFLAMLGQFLFLVAFVVAVQGPTLSKFGTRYPWDDAFLFVIWVFFLLVMLAGAGYVLSLGIARMEVGFDGEHILVRQGRFRLPGLCYQMKPDVVDAVVLNWNPTLVQTGTEPIEESILLKTKKQNQDHHEARAFEETLEAMDEDEREEYIDEMIEDLEAEVDALANETSLFEDWEELKDAVEDAAEHMKMRRINVSALTLGDRVALKHTIKEWMARRV